MWSTMSEWCNIMNIIHGWHCAVQQQRFINIYLCKALVNCINFYWPRKTSGPKELFLHQISLTFIVVQNTVSWLVYTMFWKLLWKPAAHGSSSFKRAVIVKLENDRKCLWKWYFLATLPILLVTSNVKNSKKIESEISERAITKL
jgi:hypothetical protein